VKDVKGNGSDLFVGNIQAFT